MDISIRKEEKRNRNFAYDVNRLAFGREEEAEIADKIRENEGFIPELSLVAETEGKVVGHVIFSKNIIKGDKTYESLILGPIAVLLEYQKNGIGFKLIRAGIKKRKNWAIVQRY